MTQTRNPPPTSTSPPSASARRFWAWDTSPDGDRVLALRGVIAEESWYADDITPAAFRAELEAGDGPVTVWINSPGGDCIAAAEIYTMLTEYPGRVTVKIDGLAASAASVVAMAGDEVVMSPVAMMMIHNPATITIGDSTEMARAIDMLGAVKESIINAYQHRTGLPRDELSALMDGETWMDATKAIELGFADRLLDTPPTAPAHATGEPVVFARRTADRNLINQLTTSPPREVGPPAAESVAPGRDVRELKLNLLAHLP